MIGRSPTELAALCDALAAYLAGDAPAPSPALAVFAPALAYRARHPSIRLAFDAAAEAAARALPAQKAA